ncbi:MAG: outer membrane protein assembly factor BamD [Christiangramia sp.]|uniref:Lipoprotein, putative n=1 Tax=Christiangramia flava JLT2011 TaxID=1229726 RepID=A0A1L7I0M1_9FLAO|nr:outer membrane protein assembly factor BamD [Christiangramia flava]APU67148.1 lipoprotein, putative [Christiangramia flava JLT2011]OSS38080.1 Outer membrane assembly lipoprotein YfiO [Christiangramia flava JLT2011]
MMKKGILALGLLMLVTSCSEYQKLLKSDDTAKKYATAEELYTQGKEEKSNKKLRKSIRILEQIEPQFRGKPQGQRLSYMLADAHYQLGDYFVSPFEFERFQQLYANSEKTEEASFKEAASYYYRTPPYNLDQTDTKKAMEELQEYLNKYPQGEYADQASDMAAELQRKLEKKAFEIARQYHKTEFYKAAIASFTNFIADYPGTPFREEAFYYRFDSAYKLATNSVAFLMEERLKEAKTYYEAYKKYYPEGERMEEMNASLEDINSRLQNF